MTVLKSRNDDPVRRDAATMIDAIELERGSESAIGILKRIAFRLPVVEIRASIDDDISHDLFHTQP